MGDLRTTKIRRRRFWLLAFVACAAAVGCLQRPVPLAPTSDSAYRSSSEVESLEEEQRRSVVETVDELCGTPSQPRFLGEPERDAAKLASAQKLFSSHCAECHGVTGDGVGLIGDLLDPRPRDFRRGVFKFQSTQYGAKPLASDLRRTIQHGLPGSMMPAFPRLTAAELDSLVEHVILLARRGELERQLVLAVDNGETIDTKSVDEIVVDILASWKEAPELLVEPLSPQPVFTAESEERGKAAFIARGCSKCHGEDGAGQTAQNLRGGLKDYWGFPARAADLTKGRLKGGREPLDVYRRILGGINGTPMPSFRASLGTEPETIWDLVAYVLRLGA